MTALHPLRAGYLRTHPPTARPARRPAAEAVTATRVLNQVRNPRLPSQPIFTVAATVLLGVTLTAPDRGTAWIRAHQQLRTDLAALRPIHIRLHIEALDKSWVRIVGPDPSTVARPVR